MLNIFCVSLRVSILKLIWCRRRGGRFERHTSSASLPNVECLGRLCVVWDFVHLEQS